jgi:c-di-GMP-related signal transduction protein
LENFAAFAKLLQKRLQHEAPETVDLTGLVSLLALTSMLDPMT